MKHLLPLLLLFSLNSYGQCSIFNSPNPICIRPYYGGIEIDIDTNIGGGSASEITWIEPHRVGFSPILCSDQGLFWTLVDAIV